MVLSIYLIGVVQNKVYQEVIPNPHRKQHLLYKLLSYDRQVLKIKAFYLKLKSWCKEKWGIADTNGNVLMTKYDYIENFHNGYAKVVKFPWWLFRWTSKFYNFDWKKIDKNFIEYDIIK